MQGVWWMPQTTQTSGSSLAMSTLPCRWYHGGLSGKDAEKLLLEHGTDGSFLVRESKTTPGNYVLSSRSSPDTVTHVIIRNIGRQFDVGGGELFNDLASLIEHYRTHPMVETTGAVVRMDHPFNATRVSAVSIQRRMEELNKETDEVFGHAGFWEEFEQLQHMEERNLRSRKEGQRPENKTKNRYVGGVWRSVASDAGVSVVEVTQVVYSHHALTTSTHARTDVATRIAVVCTTHPCISASHGHPLFLQVQEHSPL